MSSAGWGAKRFWKLVEIGDAEGGFAILLDGRTVRTPGKKQLVAPTRAAASAAAAEWEAQEEHVDPAAMPVTRFLNTAIDRVQTNFDEVVADVAAYGESDLLCYRASAPEALRTRQAEAWDPPLAWAAETFGARLILTEGVMHTPQPAASTAALAQAVGDHAPYSLTALHDLVALSGSLVLGLAVAARALTAEEAWGVSRVDEDWQVEQWGVDEDAAATAAIKRAEFLFAAGFLKLLDEEG